jgi:hypothetical protein
MTPEQEAAAIIRRDAGWTVTLSGVAERMLLAGRRPSSHSDDYQEQRDAGWITTQRTHMLNGNLAENRIAALEAAIPGWSVVQQKGSNWRPAADAAIEWAAAHGQIPHPDSADAVERTHGRWTDRQRRSTDLTAEQAAHLDEGMPGWRVRQKPTSKRQPRPKTDIAAMIEANTFVPRVDRWEGYPRGIGGVLAYLDNSRQSALGIPDHYLDRGHANEELSDDAFGEARDYLIGSVELGRLSTARPGRDGAYAVSQWVTWSEHRDWDGDFTGDFTSGLQSAVVALMASKLKLPSDEALAYATGEAAPSLALYLTANQLAVTHAVAKVDLERWAAGLRSTDVDQDWRGRAIAGVSLSQLDHWWGFLHAPGIASDMYRPMLR